MGIALDITEEPPVEEAAGVAAEELGDFLASGRSTPAGPLRTPLTIDCEPRGRLYAPLLGLWGFTGIPKSVMLPETVCAVRTWLIRTCRTLSCVGKFPRRSGGLMGGRPASRPDCWEVFRPSLWPATAPWVD